MRRVPNRQRRKSGDVSRFQFFVEKETALPAGIASPTKKPANIFRRPSMKKRGFFFVLVLALSTAMLCASDNQYTDLGTAQTIEVTEEQISDAQANTGSTVAVITKEQIETYHAESTADLVGKVIGTSYTSNGSLGAVQTVSIRGFDSNKTLIYLDGELLNTAHQSTVDLTSIPASVIDHIEIIKNGTGNLGKAVAFGGIINIVTKQASKDNPVITVSAENGSFLPKQYTEGAETKRNGRSLVDSQKLDVTFSNKFSDKLALLTNIGGVYAANGYTYKNMVTKSDDLQLRSNAAFTDVHGMVNMQGSLTDKLSYQSNNLFSYQYYRVPGSLQFGLTPDNNQKMLTLSTNNTFSLDNLKVSATYEYNPLWYHDTTSTPVDSVHKKHKAAVGAEETWAFSETANLKTGEELSLDYVDSNAVGTHSRLEPRVYANGGFYFFGGKLGFYPAVSLSYATTPNTFLPSASIGASFSVTKPFSVTASASYAEKLPTFSDLYWPTDAWGTHGNADLKKEKGVNGEIGITYGDEILTYEASGFTRYMLDAITWYYNASTYEYYPENIAKSIYFGTEQSITVKPCKGLTLHAGYLFNQSYDLSSGQTIADGVEVTGIRKHTMKFTAAYAFRMFTFSLDGQYLGKTYKETLPSVFLMNAVIKAQVMKTLEVYAAIDNLLDTSYYLSYGYPMPGMKIRLGATYTF